jgi:hypothetical protein
VVGSLKLDGGKVCTICCVYVIRCEDVMVKNRVPPQQMHTPYLILLCPEPKKKNTNDSQDGGLAQSNKERGGL